MKKFLIIGALVLTVATSMVAGTLATYTKSVDFNGDVAAKRFAFTAEGTETQSIDIKLAPNESKNWDFSVTNRENGVTSEVPMDVKISVTLPSGWAELGVKTQVEFNGQGLKLANTDGGNTFTGTFENIFTANEAKELTGSLMFKWDDEIQGLDALHTAAGEAGKTGAITVRVTGTQHIGA